MNDEGTGEPARRIKEEWERRAQSRHRDFYVASHAGWQDPERWRRQAEVDSGIATLGFAPETLARLHLLEIGCGVGRLVPCLAPRIASYTGFDVSPSMVAEARRRCAPHANARFFESDGGGVPVPAQDRLYDLVIAAAVFIHCPIEVCRSLTAGAWPLLREGGELRVQVRADPDDTEGIIAGAAAVTLETEAEAIEGSIDDEQRALMDEPSGYAGHAFRYAEARAFFEEFGRTELYRFDWRIIYARVLNE